MTVATLIRQLKKLDQALPVYFFSGNEEYERAAKAKVVDYIEGSGGRAVVIDNYDDDDD